MDPDFDLEAAYQLLAQALQRLLGSVGEERTS
jgi:hypothetical protein